MKFNIMANFYSFIRYEIDFRRVIIIIYVENVFKTPGLETD